MLIELNDEEVALVLESMDSFIEADKDYFDPRNHYRVKSEEEDAAIRRDIAIRERVVNRIREKMNPKDYLK